MAKNILHTLFRGKKMLSSIRPGKLQLQNASASLPNPFDVGMNAPSDLLGRDMVSFENYTTEDIYSLLWIAQDLKQRGQLPKIGQGKSISVISSNPVRKISLSSAGTKLGAATTFVRLEDINYENMDFEILGKTVGSACDMVVVDCQDLDHKNVENFATGCTVPVVCVESSKLCPLYCLSELLTLSEHYEYLRRISISYVGQASDQLLNTYALLLPKVGMHLHFLINGNIDQNIWKQGIELSAGYNTELKQFEDLHENVYRTHVISIAPNTLDLPEITTKDTKEMDLNWTILHKNVLQKTSFTSKEFLRCQQSLVWKNLNNMQWIFGATLIATTTPKYSPTIIRPQFEGQP